MKIINQELRARLKRANVSQLEENIYSYPDDETHGESEMEIVLDETEYLIEMYDTDGTTQKESLIWAKQIIKDTDGGKSFKISYSSLTDKVALERCLRQQKNDIQVAKGIINEHRRLKNFAKWVQENYYKYS